MNRESRLAMAHPLVRRGLWWAWFGGGLVWSATVEAPGPISEATGLSGPGVPAGIVWLALAAGLLSHRLGAAPRSGLLAALGPLVVSGLAPSPSVTSAGLVLAGLAGGWVVGAVCGQSGRDDTGRAAGGGLGLLAAAGGFVLLPLSPLWTAALGVVVLGTGLTILPPPREPNLEPRGVPEGGALLRAADLRLSFGPRQVLDGASLGLDAGELVALVGGNGVGKSTLLRVLAGHLLPDSGRLALGDHPTLGASPEELARLGVTLASGSRPVFPDLSVRENLRMALWVREADRGSRARLVDAALARFPELPALADAPAGTLSGGEQRLLTLTASLLTRPRVLLADEVTLGLSAAARRRALASLRAAADAGVAVLVVEHELRDLAPLADRFLHIEHGTLTEAQEPLPPAARFIPSEGA